MKEIREIKKEALSKLQGNWGEVVGTILAYSVIMLIIHLILGFMFNFSNQASSNIKNILNLILGGPIALGFATFYLSLIRYKKTSYRYVLNGFSDFGNAFGVNLMVGVFSFLWSLLFIIPMVILIVVLIAVSKAHPYYTSPFIIIPGIIAITIFLNRYLLAFYILSDDPNKGVFSSISKSVEYMDGYKVKAFLLNLSFIGWTILAIVTLGIGFLWLGGYTATAQAIFYEEILKVNGVYKVDEE